MAADHSRVAFGLFAVTALSAAVLYVYYKHTHTKKPSGPQSFLALATMENPNPNSGAAAPGMPLDGATKTIKSLASAVGKEVRAEVALALVDDAAQLRAILATASSQPGGWGTSGWSKDSKAYQIQADGSRAVTAVTDSLPKGTDGTTAVAQGAFFLVTVTEKGRKAGLDATAILQHITFTIPYFSTPMGLRVSAVWPLPVGQSLPTGKTS